jgi:RNA polymerase sigma-70 factor (ECF subfamily)
MFVRDDPRARWAIARVKAGDREALGLLYELYASHVRHFAHWMLGDPDAADDVTQTVFERLLTKAHLYEPRAAPFETWLLRVARNVALDELRRRRPELMAEPFADEVAVPETSGRDDSLRTALATLPAAQREVVILRLFVGLSAAETAGRLSRTEASVNNLQKRGRARLRRVLAGLDAAPAVERHDVAA